MAYRLKTYIMLILFLFCSMFAEQGNSLYAKKSSAAQRVSRNRARRNNVMKEVPDSVFYGKYKYIKILDSSEVPSVTDEEFYRNSRKLVFVCAKIDVNEKSATIRELVDEVIPRINRDSLQLDYMMVRGAASPEGPWNFNVWLGEHRCLQLFNYINSRLKFPARKGRYSQSSVPEDYEGLLKMMHDANDPMTQRIEDIVRKYSPSGDFATLKTTLMNLDKGKVWQYLLKTYFPELRSAKVMFFFKKHVVDVSENSDYLDPVPFVFPSTSRPLPLLLGQVQTQLPPEPEERLVRRHVLALRTNLLYDFFYMPGHYWAPSPNIQMEYYPKDGHITANLGFTCPYWHWWNRYQFWQIRDYVMEGRYYIKGGGQFIGPYVSAYVHTNIYGIGLSKEKGWEGEGLGAGVMGGYVMHISKNKRWRLEFSLGLGFYTSKYDPYVYGNPFNRFEDGLYYYKYYGKKADFKERQHRFNWLGPTNIGIHLTYDVLYRRIQKKGWSFNRTEKVIKKKGGRTWTY